MSDDAGSIYPEMTAKDLMFRRYDGTVDIEVLNENIAACVGFAHRLGLDMDDMSLRAEHIIQAVTEKLDELDDLKSGKMIVAPVSKEHAQTPLDAIEEEAFAAGD